MGHQTIRSGYNQLVERLNRFPHGAPPSDTLYAILRILMDENEARLLSLLPLRPFTANDASRVWKTSASSAQDTLEKLAGRAVLLDLELNGRRLFALPPPMAGFFDFSMMRIRGDIDQRLLAELFHQYLNVEDEFIKLLLSGGETQFARALVDEPSLPSDNALHILDYERASEIIRTASHIGVGLCFCRHTMQHVGESCDAPLEICLSLNDAGSSLIKHGHARKIGSSEALDLLEQARSHGLVQIGENVRKSVSFLCNCCGCCCEVMRAGRRLGITHPVHTTRFIPVVSAEKCRGCGKCAAVCPIAAMTVVPAESSPRHASVVAHLDATVCLGCGVCVRVCPSSALSLTNRKEQVITPINTFHRIVLTAVERGKLQNIIFDNRALYSHRAMAAILGVILRLPPLQRSLAQRQLKSRYVEAVLERLGH